MISQVFDFCVADELAQLWQCRFKVKLHPSEERSGNDLFQVMALAEKWIAARRGGEERERKIETRMVIC